MPEPQAKENPSRIIPLTADDYIIMQLKDLKDEFRDSRKELNARMDRLEAKQETTRKELNERIDKVDAKIDKLADRVDKLEEKFDAKFNQLDAKIDKLADRVDKLEEKLDAKFDALASKIDSSNKHGNLMTTSVIGIALGVLYVIFFK